MEMTSDEIMELAKEIAIKLKEDIKFTPFDAPALNTKESFERFFKKREKFLLNIPVAEIAYMFYLQGISDGPRINNEISFEKVDEIFNTNEFLENVEDWLNKKNQKVQPLPNNPIVETVKKVFPYEKCQAYYDDICDGRNCEKEVIEKINLEEMINGDSKC